jgi:hypothetical protein
MARAGPSRAGCPGPSFRRIMHSLRRNSKRSTSLRSSTISGISLRNNLWSFSLMAMSILGLLQIPFYETQFDRLQRPWFSRHKLFLKENISSEHTPTFHTRTLQLSAHGDHLLSIPLVQQNPDITTFAPSIMMPSSKVSQSALMSSISRTATYSSQVSLLTLDSHTRLIWFCMSYMYILISFLH